MNDQEHTENAQATPLESVEETKTFMKSTYGDGKADKSNELNSSMSIANTDPDELTNKLRGGLN